MKYLYGASVHGIQDFIFESNKLKEIVGASEFVEAICTRLFRQSLGNRFSEEQSIIGAAGNIRYLFSDEQLCQSVVRNFPFIIMKEAPGIAISQTVVTVEDEITNIHFENLEEKLDIQRNKPIVHLSASFMAIERSRKNGKAAEKILQDKDGYIFLSKHELLKERESEKSKLSEKMIPPGYNSEVVFPKEIEEIVKQGDKKDTWLAIVHADGNGLGKLIQRMMQQLQGSRLLNTYQQFSKKLEAATKQAAQHAFQKVFTDKQTIANTKIIPMRPVLLGGDDITFIIKAAYALEFTYAFLLAFETATINHFSEIDWEGLKPGLTACAGVAFIKPNYPFHYGADMAETLCRHAKKVAKEIALIESTQIPSALMFQQIHSSFIDEYNDMVKREQTTKSGKRFDFGPYFLTKQNGYASLDELQHWVKLMQEENAPKSQLRALITEYHDNEASATQYESRIQKLNAESLAKLELDKSIFKKRNNGNGVGYFSPVLDIIKIAEIQKMENYDA